MIGTFLYIYLVTFSSLVCFCLGVLYLKTKYCLDCNTNTPLYCLLSYLSQPIVKEDFIRYDVEIKWFTCFHLRFIYFRHLYFLFWDSHDRLLYLLWTLSFILIEKICYGVFVFGYNWRCTGFFCFYFSCILVSACFQILSGPL